MRKSRFMEKRNIALLKESDAGTTTKELICRHGSAPTPSMPGARGTAASRSARPGVSSSPKTKAPG